MIFDATLSGTLGKRDPCRDKDGKFVPVPQCLPKRRPLKGGVGDSALAWQPGWRAFEIEGRQPCIWPAIPARKYRFRNSRSFGDVPSVPDPRSYQDIWNYLWDSCVVIAGEDSCRRLLGHTPFVCPVDEPKTGSFLTPLLIGVAIGKLFL